MTTRRLDGAVSVVVFEHEGQEPSVGAVLRTLGCDATSVGASEASILINHHAATVAVLDGRSMGDAVIDVLVRIRASRWSIPTLVVCPDEPRVIAALNAGADDCFGPPYSAAELCARVHALLRRAYQVSTWRPAPLSIGRLTVCPVTREATRDGIPVTLSPKEHELLLALLEQRGRVVTRAELLARIWPERARPNARSLDIHIAWLRRKIELDPRQPTIIRTIRAIGYQISET